MFYNIDDLYGMEREAADTYVDGSSLGGSTTYNPTITKLCADWRELQAQVAALTAKLAAAQCAIAEAASTFNKSLCAGCDTLLAQASETQGAQVEIVELQDEWALLTAALEECDRSFSGTQSDWIKSEGRVYALIAQVAALTAKLDAAHAALADIAAMKWEDQWGVTPIASGDLYPETLAALSAARKE